MKRHFVRECTINPCIFNTETEGQRDTKGSWDSLPMEMMDCSLGCATEECQWDKPLVIADVTG